MIVSREHAAGCDDGMSLQQRVFSPCPPYPSCASGSCTTEDISNKIRDVTNIDDKAVGLSWFSDQCHQLDYEIVGYDHCQRGLIIRLSMMVVLAFSVCVPVTSYSAETVTYTYDAPRHRHP